MPAGARVLPFRSNIPRISDFCFEGVDDTYPRRALEVRERGGHAIVAGDNYGQGSSREHAALAPRFLGLRLVLAKGFARIHGRNLVNFGILPVTFEDPADLDAIGPGDVLLVEDVRGQLQAGKTLEVRIEGRSGKAPALAVAHTLTARQVDVLLAGGLVNWTRGQLFGPESPRV